jgi:hypothetical protein
LESCRKFREKEQKKVKAIEATVLGVRYLTKLAREAREMTCSSQRVLETRVISDFRPAHDILREEPLHPNSRAELYNTCREGSRMRMSTDISEAKAEYRCAAHSSSKCFCIVLLCSVSHTHTIHISKLPNTQTPYIPSKSLEINIHSLCSSTPPTQTCRLMGVDSFCFFALSSSIRAFLLYLF